MCCWSENRTLAGRAAAAGGAVSAVGCGGQFAGVWVDALDGDVVAEAFEAADVVAGLAAGVHALFVVVGPRSRSLAAGSDSRAQKMVRTELPVATRAFFSACA